MLATSSRPAISTRASGVSNVRRADNRCVQLGSAACRSVCWGTAYWHNTLGACGGVHGVGTWRRIGRCALPESHEEAACLRGEALGLAQSIPSGFSKWHVRRPSLCRSSAKGRFDGCAVSGTVRGPRHRLVLHDAGPSARSYPRWHATAATSVDHAASASALRRCNR